MPGLSAVPGDLDPTSRLTYPCLATSKECPAAQRTAASSRRTSARQTGQMRYSTMSASMRPILVHRAGAPPGGAVVRDQAALAIRRRSPQARSGGAGLKEEGGVGGGG